MSSWLLLSSLRRPDPPSPPNESNVIHHMIETYFRLRVCLIVVAFLLPVALFVTGHLVDPPDKTLGSLSAYYHTPLRWLFAGPLLLLAAVLVIYKGAHETEDVALNVAAFFLVLLVYFPTEKPEGLTTPNRYIDLPGMTEDWAWIIHIIAAALFFLSVAYSCYTSPRYTLEPIDGIPWKVAYWKAYKVIAGLLVVLAGLFLVGLVSKPPYYILAVEWAAIWVFAAYWVTKTMELRRGRSEAPLEAPPLRTEEMSAHLAEAEATARLAPRADAGAGRGLGLGLEAKLLRRFGGDSSL